MRNARQAKFEPFDASSWKIGIVTAQFNQSITQQLQASAIARAADYQIEQSNIDVIKVAGAIEIPLMLQHLAKAGQYKVLMAIGCIIRGDTPHFDYVAKYVTEGILRVQLDHNMPIAFGILTCQTEEQAISRANLGGDHLEAVLQQAKALT